MVTCIQNTPMAKFKIWERHWGRVETPGIINCNSLRNFKMFLRNLKQATLLIHKHKISFSCSSYKRVGRVTLMKNQKCKFLNICLRKYKITHWLCLKALRFQTQKPSTWRLQTCVKNSPQPLSVITR